MRKPAEARDHAMMGAGEGKDESVTESREVAKRTALVCNTLAMHQWHGEELAAISVEPGIPALVQCGLRNFQRQRVARKGARIVAEQIAWHLVE